MKHVPFFFPGLAALALSLAWSGPVGAQVKAPAAPEAIEQFSLGGPEGLPMEEAVRMLAEQAEGGGQPMPNILFEEGARNALVPELTLRNVTVVGALQLMAVAADCAVEPIEDREEGNDVLGYRLTRKAPAGGGAVGFGGSMGGAMASITEADATEATEEIAGERRETAPALRTVPVPAPTPGLTPGVSGALSGGVTVFGGAAPMGGGGGMNPYGGAQEVVTTVYALGPVVGEMKLEDIEKALQDLLAMGGGDASATTLRLHEATNTLIVRGTPSDQQMVTGMLSALSENQAVKAAAAKSRDNDQTVQMMRKLEMELSERVSQLRRLEDMLAQTEAQKAELREELATLKADLNSKLEERTPSGDAKADH